MASTSAARLEPSLFFGVEDDSAGSAIFTLRSGSDIPAAKTAGRVTRNQFLQLKNGSFADQLEMSFSNAQA